MAVDGVIVRGGPVAVPLDYVVPTGTEIVPRTVSAALNGGAAGGSFVPVLEVIAPSGAVTAYCARRVSISAGASVLVSWFPGVAEADESSSSAAAGTVASVTSPDSSIAVTAPTGPATKLALPTSGAAAGTYGDATHTSQVTVNAAGIVTAAAQVGISGIAGSGLVKLFESTLGAAAASIDTGAAAIPSGHGDLVIVLLLQTSVAAALSAAQLTLNGDVGAHYDNAQWTLNNGAASSGRSLGSANWIFNCAGSIAAVYPTIVTTIIPAYDATTLKKRCELLVSQVDTGAGSTWLIEQRACGWASTAAINQVTVTANAGNLVAGSRMAIFGTE